MGYKKPENRSDPWKKGVVGRYAIAYIHEVMIIHPFMFKYPLYTGQPKLVGNANANFTLKTLHECTTTEFRLRVMFKLIKTHNVHVLF